MKILMLSWEYPPKNIGGIAEHVYHLSREIYEMGHEVHVITSNGDNIQAEEIVNGVFIHRVNPLNIDTNDFIKWVMHLNFSIIERSIRLINDLGNFEIIHAHDWICTYSACALKGAYKIPMIATIHATEYGRNGGIKTEMQYYISQTEWKLCYEAWKVVVCSNYMEHELIELFKLPESKIWVIPNGVSLDVYNDNFDKADFRRIYANDDEKIVYYVGRHVYEKGLHLLVGAAAILCKDQKIKFVIAGIGPMSDAIKEQVSNNGLDSSFYFTGFIDNTTKNKIYSIADVAVFPSLYEPFGIVALEAMAAGCPVIVTETGGLNEIIQNGINGLKAYTNSSDSIVWNINQILNNKELANKLIENGLRSVNEHYNWKFASSITLDMYACVKKELSMTEWD